MRRTILVLVVAAVLVVTMSSAASAAGRGDPGPPEGVEAGAPCEIVLQHIPIQAYKNFSCR